MINLMSRETCAITGASVDELPRVHGAIARYTCTNLTKVVSQIYIMIKSVELHIYVLTYSQMEVRRRPFVQFSSAAGRSTQGLGAAGIFS